MIEKSLGDLLREYRVAKGLQISDIESRTGIPAQYLLAIELDQLKLLPQEQVENYLETYAQSVELPLSTIYEKSGLSKSEETHHDEVEAPVLEEAEIQEQVSVLKPVPVAPEWTEPIQVFDSGLSSETISVPLFEPVQELDLEEPVIPMADPVETLESVVQEEPSHPVMDSHLEDTQTVETPDVSEETKAFPIFEQPLSFETTDLTTVLSQKMDTVVAEEAESVPLTRRNREQQVSETKKGTSYIGLTLLSLVALAVVAFVGYTFWNQFSTKQEQASQDDVTAVATTTTTQSVTQAISVINRTEGGGEYLTAYVSQTSAPIEVTFELTNTAGESWVSLSDDSVGEIGSLLNATTPSYTATLSDGVTRGVLTIGITPDVRITINGEQLDTSALTTQGMSYVTLVVE